jgi:hypothetical protein
MSTSPQLSASDKYLYRMREEGHWNRRRARDAVELHGPTLPPVFNEATAPPPVKDLRAHYAQKIWEELRESDVPQRKRDGDLWRPGSPAIEALCLYEMIGKNGDDVQSLRELIAMSDADRRELRLWTEQEPQLRYKIEGMIYYRELVLSAFNRLVENNAALTGSQTALASRIACAAKL